MRYFKVDARKEPSKHGLMPAMQMYLLEGPKKKRDLMRQEINIDLLGIFLSATLNEMKKRAL